MLGPHLVIEHGPLPATGSAAARSNTLMQALPLEAPPRRGVCVRCQRPLGGRAAYVLGGARCLGCVLRYGPLLRRSTITALVVGTILVAINQGNVLVSGDLALELAWKIPLTYVVPFCVATWGALSNSRIS